MKASGWRQVSGVSSARDRETLAERFDEARVEV